MRVGVAVGTDRARACASREGAMPSPAVDQPQSPDASQHAWPSDRDLASLREDVAAFAERHGVPADPRDVRVAVAPYRVCPLGAHVDHQGGRVAGMALDCGVLLGFLPAPARKTGADRDVSREKAHRTETEPEPEIGASEVLLRSDAFAGEVARFDVTRPDDDLTGVPGVFVEAAATETNDTEVSLSRRSVKEKEETSGKSSGWEKFARGAAWVLADDARLRGSAPPARGVVGVARSFPPGARMDGGGLSSSAAITVACVMAIQRVNERTEVARGPARLKEDARVCFKRRFATDAKRWRVARLARRAENERVGVRCGVLDQASIALAERDALTLIDCAGETHARIRFGADRKEERSAVFAAEPTIGKTPRDRGPSGPPGGPPFKIMLAFSGLREALTSTGYNARVEECREAARRLLRAPGASDAVLGDVSPETHAREKTRLPAHLARRAAHFFGEAKRVADGELLWRRGDLRAFGALVTESGVSSVENYECGCAPMNALRAIVCATRGVFGARFSGAGFRGCVVGLVDAAEAEAAAKSVRETYSAAFPELAGDARVELAGTGDGARIIERDDSDT